MAEVIDVRLEPVDNKRLASLCGPCDEHLRQLEKGLGVEVNHRGNVFRIVGQSEAATKAGLTLRQLYQATAKKSLNAEQVALYLQESNTEALMQNQNNPNLSESEELDLVLRNKTISARGPNQARYLKQLLNHDINFGIGPAGTGKTYLAVAAAVQAMEQNQVRRLILARPAVEAGERLGFLPGDMAQKIDPYLRPLYDALYEMLGFEHVSKLIERHVIEVAPLAFMRGRTLNEAFIILDEAQNTTIEQMKMFLTRIGFGSKVIVTGDVTQTDLPNNKQSGLRHVTEILQDVEGVSFTFFDKKDVVRHPLVQRVVAAYELAENKEP
ncbi:MAG: PhoH family protein [Nitrosopumilus sp.]|nr:PhoH family protein [Gammaproteobacteria bacterium]MDH5666163.1 PhoH family protein [Nitrosopumilus sp.]MDH5728047.1 PhoH family protein [Gammaproteobacteria bacterium]